MTRNTLSSAGEMSVTLKKNRSANMDDLIVMVLLTSYHTERYVISPILMRKLNRHLNFLNMVTKANILISRMFTISLNRKSCALFQKTTTLVLVRKPKAKLIIQHGYIFYIFRWLSWFKIIIIIVYSTLTNNIDNTYFKYFWVYLPLFQYL